MTVEASSMSIARADVRAIVSLAEDKKPFEQS
jgi:hypothetical protein